MFWFIVGLVLLVGSLFWLAGAPTKRVSDGYESNGYTKKYKEISLRGIGWIPLGLGLVLILLSMVAIVGTKNVGVGTIFSKPTGTTYGSGLHFKAPWVSITDIDATVQPEEYKGEDCIYVKIADGGSACISLAYRWRIVPEGADTVFADYRNSEDGITEAVRKALVSTNIKASINEVFGEYDPLAGAELDPDMTPEELASIKLNVVPDYPLINKAIEANVAAKIADVGGLIEIQSITVSFVKLPDSTQKRIDAFTAAVQDTRIALQEVATKKAQAQGNKELAESLQDPNVLVSSCFDALRAGDFQAPAGFSCWPGGQGSVVVPSAK